MKQYVKPTVDVVELAVRENIAQLPAALSVQNVQIGENQSVLLTTYNLAAQNGSDPVNG